MTIGRGTFIPFAKTTVLPHLRRLDLTSFYSLDWENLLGPFRFPSLETLTLLIVRRAIRAITSLVTRSHCTLQSLTIEIQGEYFNDLITLLASIPSLVDLDVKCCVPPSMFVDICKGGFLPRLRKLYAIVEPRGLHAFLDLMECYFGGTLHTPEIFHVKIEYMQGPDMYNVSKRFKDLVQEHKDHSVWNKIWVDGLESEGEGDDEWW